MPHLVLWDIDHTLIENHGVSKAIYGRAYEILTGSMPEVPAETDGRTDPLIMSGMLTRGGCSLPDWGVIERALETAGREWRLQLSLVGSVLAGARETVSSLAVRHDIRQSVLTGNIRQNAIVKLDALGLASLFDFEIGAYGSDHEDRARLVDVARARAAEKTGVTFRRSNTILVGDTPRDIDAGRRGGAVVVAVATGLFTVAQLRAEGAALVLPDLVDAHTAILALLGA